MSQHRTTISGLVTSLRPELGLDYQHVLDFYGGLKPLRVYVIMCPECEGPSRLIPLGVPGCEGPKRLIF